MNGIDIAWYSQLDAIWVCLKVGFTQSSNGNFLGNRMINEWRTRDTQTLRFPFHPALGDLGVPRWSLFYINRGFNCTWMLFRFFGTHIFSRCPWNPWNSYLIALVKYGKVLSQHPRSLRHLHVKHGGSALGVGQRRSVVNTFYIFCSISFHDHMNIWQCLRILEAF